MGWRMFALLSYVARVAAHLYMYVCTMYTLSLYNDRYGTSDVLYRFLGTSGQNVENIFKFSSVNDRLTILENTFLWRHISPTSPDTLSE